MTVELLQNLSIIAYIAAGVLFLVGIILFFMFDVPKLYGDLSGRTARKAIEAIRKQNENSGNKAYKPSPVNAARGKLTDKISPSGNLIASTGGFGVSIGTEKLVSDSEVISSSGATTVLERTDETTVLVRDGNDSFNIEMEMSFSGSSEIIE